jgi:hypothetical protein
MRWSHLHGDMQGRRGAYKDTSPAQHVLLGKVLSEIPCRVSNNLPRCLARGNMQTGSYRGNPPCQCGSGQSRGKS